MHSQLDTKAPLWTSGRPLLDNLVIVRTLRNSNFNAEVIRYLVPLLVKIGQCRNPMSQFCVFNVTFVIDVLCKVLQ